MALGVNRDYKTTERRAWKNLAQHAKIMNRLMAEGLSREEASSQALKEMMKPKAKKQPKEII